MCVRVYVCVCVCVQERNVAVLMYSHEILKCTHTHTKKKQDKIPISAAVEKSHTRGKKEGRKEIHVIQVVMYCATKTYIAVGQRKA